MNEADKDYMSPKQRERFERHLEGIYCSDTDSDLTDEDRRIFQKQFEDLEREAEELREFFAAKSQEWVRQAAGEHLSAMTRSAGEAEKYLESSEPSLRAVAMHLLYDFWKKREDYADVYERLAMSDPDEDVRVRAFEHLASCYSYTRDRRIAAKLAKIVLDDKETEAVRVAAYRAVTEVEDVQASIFVKFPEEVDWPFVKNCALAGD